MAPRGSIELRIEVTPDLRVLARRIRASGDPRALRRELLRGLKEGAAPALAATRAAARALPAKPGSSGALRARLATVANIQIRTTGRDVGVQVRIKRSRMGERAAMAVVTNRGVWRHPVYGNRRNWVYQRSRRGWFDNANLSARPAVAQGLKRAADRIERRIARGGL